MHAFSIIMSLGISALGVFATPLQTVTKTQGVCYATGTNIVTQTVGGIVETVTTVAAGPSTLPTLGHTVTIDCPNQATTIFACSSTVTLPLTKTVTDPALTRYVPFYTATTTKEYPWLATMTATVCR